MGTAKNQQEIADFLEQPASADAEIAKCLEVRTLTASGTSLPPSSLIRLCTFSSSDLGMIGQHGVFVREGHTLPSGSYFEYIGTLRIDEEVLDSSFWSCPSPPYAPFRTSSVISTKWRTTPIVTITGRSPMRDPNTSSLAIGKVRSPLLRNYSPTFSSYSPTLSIGNLAMLVNHPSADTVFTGRGKKSSIPPFPIPPLPDSQCPLPPSPPIFSLAPHPPS